MALGALGTTLLGRKLKKPLLRGALQIYLSAQRAYLAGGRPPTTSAAEELNFRVRDGNGCGLLAMVTRIETVFCFSPCRLCAGTSARERKSTLTTVLRFVDCTLKEPIEELSSKPSAN